MPRLHLPVVAALAGKLLFGAEHAALLGILGDVALGEVVGGGLIRNVAVYAALLFRFRPTLVLLYQLLHGLFGALHEEVENQYEGIQ